MLVVSRSSPIFYSVPFIFLFTFSLVSLFSLFPFSVLSLSFFFPLF